jgi:DNA-binding NarL/FixJ family response regulator
MTLWCRDLPKALPLQVVGEAADGREGLALATRLQPDLVITDVHMPGIAGLELVELLRVKYPAMRSIVTSTDDAPTLRAASLRHGADAFVAKGRLLEELPLILKRLFVNSAEPTPAACSE